MDDISFLGDLKSNLDEIPELLAIHETVNYDNALVLNQTLQRRLQKVQQNLYTLLRAVREKYARNKRLIASRQTRQRGFGHNSALLCGGTFYFKGNMYFRDGRRRGCPNTPDYEQRRQMGEMFPMDLNLRARHIWTINDKSAIIRGIKAQIIEHFEVYKSSKLSKIKLKVAVHKQKLRSLLKLVDKHDTNDFKIDWVQISAIELSYRHAPSSCEAMWNVYLHPKFNRNPWTPAEEKCLIDAAQEYNFQDWSSIAAAVGERSDFQCFLHFKTKQSSLIVMPKTKWSKSDDDVLVDVVNKCTVNSVTNWTEVMLHFPGRAKTSLICRYYYSLNPLIIRGPFTPEEDLLLLAAVDEYKGKFYCFPRSLFPNRTLCQLRSRYYNTLTQRNKIEFWTILDDERLMAFVAEHGISSWLLCAQQLGNHTRISCRTRYLTIEKFFKKNPDAKLHDIPRRRTRKSANGITTENWTEKLEQLINPEPQPQPEVSKTLTTRKRKMRSLKTSGDCDKSSVVAKTRANREIRPALKLQYYNFFKYAYNLRLDTNTLTALPSSDYALRIAVDVLKFAPHIAAIAASSSANINLTMAAGLPLQMRETYAQMLKNISLDITVSEGYELQPNWSTALAFRAICIQAGNRDVASKNGALSEDTMHEALCLFRQRFRTLLYKTILLSRLRPDDISGLWQAMLAATLPWKAVESPAVVNINAELSLQHMDCEPDKDSQESQITIVKMETEC